MGKGFYRCLSNMGDPVLSDVEGCRERPIGCATVGRCGFATRGFFVFLGALGGLEEGGPVSRALV